jgi:hypothetical protein
LYTDAAVWEARGREGFLVAESATPEPGSDEAVRRFVGKLNWLG